MAYYNKSSNCSFQNSNLRQTGNSCPADSTCQTGSMLKARPQRPNCGNTASSGSMIMPRSSGSERMAMSGCADPERMMMHRDIHGLDGMPLAMSYVPWQQLEELYQPCKALSEGTAFPELNLIFCGVRG